jgi:hypothetical protein
MKKFKKVKLTLLFSLAAFGLVNLRLPAQQPVNQISSDSSIKLVYTYPANQPVRYYTESKIIQTMDIMGQSMQVNINSVFGCTIKATGTTDNNLNLEVTVDTIGQSTESPMGSSGGGIMEVKGKVFNIVINPTGKSVDISEAKNIVYNIEGSGESNMSETFINFFPVLPENPIRPGDTWNSTDSVNTKTSSTSVKMSMTSENKMEGFENIDGTECAKISAILSGERVMDVNSQGMDIHIKGPFTGTATFFFSLKDGYFVKQIVNSKMNGEIEMTSPEAVTFPVVMDINAVNEVQK